MKAADVVKKIMKDQDIGTVQLASRLGLDRKKSNVISQRFAQENITVMKLAEMLRVLDFKVVIMPMSARIPEDAYEVDA